MEFWGVEVKPGQSYKVTPNADRVLHLSQSCVGEVKKGKEESVIVYSKVDNQKLVIGTLSADKFPQISHDLVFEKEVELSHSSKNGSIYFTGYMSSIEDESEGFPSDSSDDELGVEDFPVDIKENGKAAKPDASAAKKVKVVDPKADEDKSDESDSDDSDEDEEMDEDDSSDEEEPTPTPKGKKRSAEVGNKKPTPGDKKPTPGDKKAKLETPQKSGADGKKGGDVHKGTPYPKGGKPPASGGNKSNKSPKSTGSVSCNSCSKAFGNDSALQAHSKAKHNK